MRRFPVLVPLLVCLATGPAGAGTLGDFNNDGALTIADAVTFIRIIMGKDPRGDVGKTYYTQAVEAEEEFPLPEIAPAVAWVLIPGGAFRMGSDSDPSAPDERPVHYVVLDGFRMSACEITNAQYAVYLNRALQAGKISVKTQSGHPFDLCVFGPAPGLSEAIYYYLQAPAARISFTDGVFWVSGNNDNYPVIETTWYGAQAFAGHYGCSLPTEAEWEYACRAGSATEYYWGEEMNGDYCVYDENSWNPENAITDRKGPWRIGSKLSNAWGLYDMSGNVAEWCSDWFGEYPGGTLINPAGPPSGSKRVIRGGSWLNIDTNCRSAKRLRGDPRDGSANNVGFRVVFRP